MVKNHLKYTVYIVPIPKFKHNKLLSKASGFDFIVCYNLGIIAAVHYSLYFPIGKKEQQHTLVCYFIAATYHLHVGCGSGGREGWPLISRSIV